MMIFQMGKGAFLPKKFGNFCKKDTNEPLQMTEEGGRQMKISICMGTYNGEKYIGRQLCSILEQTRPADEVILCDDGSRDNTAAIVQKFIKDNRLEASWYLHENRDNKGYPANYYNAMDLCTGDIVFLADQDDIWEKTKLEKMTDAMEAHPEAAVLACKFGLIDEEGKCIKAVMNPSRSADSGKWKSIAVHDIFYKYEWPGMVLAYRNAWYRNWNKTIGEIPHDIFLCARAAEEGAFLQLDETLAWHRRHGNNTAAEEHRISRLLNKERKFWEIEKYLKMLEQFGKCEVFQTEEGRRTLRDKLTAMRSRYEALQSGKITRVLKSAVENRRNVRPATVVCDILIARRQCPELRK